MACVESNLFELLSKYDVVELRVMLNSWVNRLSSVRAAIRSYKFRHAGELFNYLDEGPVYHIRYSNHTIIVMRGIVCVLGADEENAKHIVDEISKRIK